MRTERRQGSCERARDHGTTGVPGHEAGARRDARAAAYKGRQATKDSTKVSPKGGEGGREGLAWEVFAGGGDGELAVFDAFGGDEFVGDLLHQSGLAADDEDFEATDKNLLFCAGMYSTLRG